MLLFEEDTKSQISYGVGFPVCERSIYIASSSTEPVVGGLDCVNFFRSSKSRFCQGKAPYKLKLNTCGVPIVTVLVVCLQPPQKSSVGLQFCFVSWMPPAAGLKSVRRQNFYQHVRADLSKASIQDIMKG